MDAAEIEKKVREIVCDHLGVIHAESRDDAKIVDDLGADSLDLVELAMEIEAEFTGNGLEITDTEVEEMTTVGALCKLVANKLQGVQ